MRHDWPVPQGRLKVPEHLVLDALAFGKSANNNRDGVRVIFSRPCGTGRRSKPYPGLASWANLSRPCGTDFVGSPKIC